MKLTTTEGALIDLIKEYINCSKYSFGLLKELYDGKENILYAYKVLKLIPKEGTIDNDVYYSFHGRGCYFEYPKDSIDIDFSFDGTRADGFDLARIEYFLKNRKDRYPIFNEEKLLEATFNSLINKMIIFKDPLERSGHLFYYEQNSVEGS